MPVPSLVTDLSATIASNSPAGSDNVFPDLDNYLRALSGFLASIRDNSGNGWVSPYAAAANPSYTGTLTGGTGVVNLGSGQFYKSATGDVGIGTTTPASYGGKLNVYAGDVVVADAGTSSGASAPRIGSAGQALVFKTNTGAGSAAEVARFDGAGNLALGVVPSAWRSGAKALQVGGFASLHTQQNGTVTLAFGAYESGSNTFSYLTTGDAPTAYSQITGQHRWFTAPSGTAGNAISFTQAMTLDASGNLAIGTASTSGRLYVVSPTQSIVKVKGGAAAGQSSAFYVERAGSTATLAAFGDAASILGGTVDQAVAIYADSSIPIVFNQSNTERARIDSSGNLLITGAGGLGYGTGSGGAVTQITSRTTGVTLNKTNGAITLVSAAGTTTWQSFTVTNSTVAATDTVIVSQKLGTDLNQIFVTAVAAGSFRISFATTGGTTTEQPVFNFAVIKAVTA